MLKMLGATKATTRVLLDLRSSVKGQMALSSPIRRESCRAHIPTAANIYDVKLPQDGSCFEYESQSKLRSAIFNAVGEFWSQVPTRKAYENPSKEEIFKVFSMTIGKSPHPMDAILDVISGSVAGTGITEQSSRNFSTIPSSALPSASIADFYATTMNKLSCIWANAPGGSSLERVVLEWIADLFGFDKNRFGGCFFSGGSMANLSALLAAREAAGVKARDFERSVAYVSRDVHYCVEKGLRIMGMAECVLRKIDVDGNRRILTHQLERQLAADVKDGLKPFVVVGTLGTTATGAIDDLSTLASLARRFNVWFHVDAAYGGFFALVDETKKNQMKGVEEADSISVDAHKSLFLPFGTGMLIVKEADHLSRPLRVRVDYVDYDEEEFDDDDDNNHNNNTVDFSPELSRDFRGFRVWLPLVYHGTRPFEDALREKLLLATTLYERLRQLPDIEVGPQPQLSIVTFRFVTKPGARQRYVEDDVIDGDDGDDNNNHNYNHDNELNRKVFSAVKRDGMVYFTTVELCGILWLRLCIMNFLSHWEDVEFALRKIAEAHQKLTWNSATMTTMTTTLTRIDPMAQSNVLGRIQ